MIINRTVRRSAFTLIEMIGVLAVIAILAALLIPKIFEAINNARVNNACISINTVKTALADHYAKYGALASDSGTAITVPATGYPAFDKVLLKEGFIDKPFAVKISTVSSNTVELAIGATTVTGSNAGFDLDGDGTSDIGSTNVTVVEAVIYGVSANDALELSKRLDGDSLSATNTSSDDLLGRVKYASPGANTEVHVYLTHR